MARSGRFGRLPRNAPDLTGTIVALLRDYNNQRESNIVDAWKNGGIFEGKKATDQMLLEFYKDKMQDVSHDDPLYEETKNTVQQYEFAIKNSKMELKYAQGRVGPGAMAHFYRSEAGKIPRNSEAWRQLMKSAAQYADHARASASSGRAAAHESALHNRESRIYNRNEAAFDMVTSVIQSIAEQGRLLSPGETSFADLRPGQVEVGRFMATVNSWNDSTDPAIVADRQRLTSEIRKVDPDFNGDFSYANLQAMSGNKNKGIKQRWDMWVHAGRKTEANAVAKEWTKNNNFVAIINSHDEFARYEAARERWESVRNSPLADAIDLTNADDEYKAILTDLQTTIPTSFTPGYAGNYLHGGLQVEIDALNGISSPNPTWHEDAVTMTPKTGELAAGEKGGDANTGGLSDAEGTAKTQREAQADLSKLATLGPDGLPLYALSHVNPSTGLPVSGTTGPVRAVPVSAMAGVGYAYAPTESRVATIQVKDPTTGETSTVRVNLAPAKVIVGENIQAQGVEMMAPGQQRTSGALETTGQAKAIGERYVREDGTTIYGYWTPNNEHLYSTVNPFVGEPVAGQGGLTVQVPGQPGTMVPATDALAPLNRGTAAGRFGASLGVDATGGSTSGGMRGQMQADFSVIAVPSTSYKSYAIADAATKPNGMAWLRDPHNRDSIRNAIAGEAGNDPVVAKAMVDEWYGLQRQQADKVDGAARLNRAEQMDEPPLPTDVMNRGRPATFAATGRPAAEAAYDPQKDLADSSMFPGYARAKLQGDILSLRRETVAARTSGTLMERNTPAARLAEQQRQLTLGAMEQQLENGDRLLRDQSHRYISGQGGAGRRNPLAGGPALPAAPALTTLGPPKPKAPAPAPVVKPPKPPKTLRRTDLSVRTQPHVWSNEPTAL